MATTTDLTTLKINYLTEEQYNEAVTAGTINENEIYMTPEDGVEYLTKADGLSKTDAASTYLTKANPVATGSFSMNRKSGSTVGNLSFTSGNGCEASGQYSHATGLSTTAIAHTSNANGWYTTASGTCSHAGCFRTEALAYQYAIGNYNDTSKAAAGEQGGTAGTAFVIGNGNSNGVSNAFRVTYQGSTVAKQAYSTTGADYAEYFEWADANVDNEERVGYFVTFEDGRFIRKANEGDYILGIVSGNPAVLGNHDECWMGQNEMDEWNRFIYVTETGIDEETGEEYEYQTYKINPDYDKNAQYIPRSERPEWDAIGMLGVLAVRDDGTCQVNGYCKVANGGIATTSDNGYRVIERVNNNIVKVVFR